jgi:Uma2 family endonuclease
VNDPSLAELRDAVEKAVGERYKLEIIGGRVVMSPPERRAHLGTVCAVCRFVSRVCDPEQDVVTERAELIVGEGDRPQPDLTVLRSAALDADLDAVAFASAEALLVVEVASPSNGEDDRRWGKKYKAYAKGMVPVYLLVDAYDERGPMVSLFTQPNGRRFLVESTALFGTSITLPDPIPAVIDSAKFPVPKHDD